MGNRDVAVAGLMSVVFMCVLALVGYVAHEVHLEKMARIEKGCVEVRP